jgi:uncharacterized protein (TIRG00374 family)
LPSDDFSHCGGMKIKANYEAMHASRHTPRPMYKWLKLGGTCAATAALVLYLCVERHALGAALSRLSPLILAGVLLTLFAQWAARSFRDQIIYAELGYSAPFTRLYPIVLTQTLLNHLPMKIGTVYAAYALRRDLRIELPHFGSLFLIHSLLMTVTASLAAAVVLAIHPSAQTPAGRLACVALITLAGLATLPVFIPVRLVEALPSRAHEFVTRAHRGLTILRSRPSISIVSLLLSLLTFALATCRLYLLYLCTSEPIKWPESIVVNAAGQLALVLSITPSAIGIREAIIGVSSPLVSVSISAGVIAASVERAIIFFALLLTVVPLHARLRRHSTLS